GVTDVGTDSASYTITNAQLSDAGSYTCVVTDSATPTPASVTSNAAVLDVVDVGAVPASGLVGLVLLGTLCLGAGVIALRRTMHQ
ncbi:MAG: immunoglobulin domain-containing protein, partial [Candidatus Hydrogenedentes bacterium]|nr:immunoglobulin domain-containing protein [Candidatus Hydrogenedentota bacterium]